MLSESRTPAYELTEDAFLGGRLRLRQPKDGHRSGIEAVLIAAATPAVEQDVIVDIGSGVGAAGLCVLARVPGARAILVEADPALGALAQANARANRFPDQVEVVICDVSEQGAATRASVAERADHAVCNPPFHDPRSRRLSPSKAAAHAVEPAVFDAWARFAASALKSGGTLTLVHRADALMLVLGGLERRFGDVHVLPLHPRVGRAATRIVVQARKGSRAPLTLLPGLVLHGEGGHGFSPAVEAVLRDGAPLLLADEAC